MDSRINDPGNHVAGTISRAVVDKKHLEDQPFFENPSDALHDVVGLVEARDNDRQATDPYLFTAMAWTKIRRSHDSAV